MRQKILNFIRRSSGNVDLKPEEVEQLRREVGRSRTPHDARADSPDSTAAAARMPRIADGDGDYESCIAEVPDEIRFGPIDDAVLSTIPAPIARRNQLLPYRIDGPRIFIAVAAPPAARVRSRIDYELKTFDIPLVPVYTVVPAEAIRKALPEYYDISAPASGPRQVENVEPGVSAIEEPDFDDPEFVGEAPETPRDQMKWIINKAIEHRAHDILIDRFARQTLIRFIVDGRAYQFGEMRSGVAGDQFIRILKDFGGEPTGRIFEPLSSSFKYPARVDGVRRELKCRVEFVPTEDGREAVSIRIQGRQGILRLSDFELSARTEKLIRKMIRDADGTYLFVGPLGHGKSTLMLAAAIENEPHVTIAAIEDPPELPIPETLRPIRQVDARAQAGQGNGDGADGPSRLHLAVKSMLRSGMHKFIIAELRDPATADATWQLAGTGMQVASTLHATDSIMAIRRLRDLGLENGEISEKLRGVFALRLLTRLCECAVPDPLDEKRKAELLMKGFPAEILENGTFRKPFGCVLCRDGYRGRAPVIEALEIDDNLRSIILRDSPDYLSSLRLASLGQGIIPLRVAAAGLAARGDIDIETAITNTPWDNEHDGQRSSSGTSYSTSLFQEARHRMLTGYQQQRLLSAAAGCDEGDA
jgi:type II secretory ATPase GspE/PulE/Tfp pilus assembly ATPase PilB-like protein